MEERLLNSFKYFCIGTVVMKRKGLFNVMVAAIRGGFRGNNTTVIIGRFVINVEKLETALDIL